MLTCVEVMKVYVETALSDSYPRIKGIRSRANFIRNIVSRYLDHEGGPLAYLTLHRDRAPVVDHDPVHHG